MTPRYHAIMAHWKNDPKHLTLEHKVWAPTPWVLDVRSPLNPSDPPGDTDRYTHMQWLKANIGQESWPIHDEPGDWYFAGATVDGETWLGFRTEGMMRRFCEAFADSVVMPANSPIDGQPQSPAIDGAKS